MPKNWKELKEGDFVKLTGSQLFCIACCDCGLTHRFDLSIRNGELGFTINSDRRMTAAIRKRKNIRVTRINTPAKGRR